jgi:hypothetical protein
MTQHKLIKKLYKSAPDYQTDIAKLLAQIISIVESHNWRIDRYQVNDRYSGHVKYIDYIVHSHNCRPDYQRKIPNEKIIARITLNNIEGTTHRCEAYKKLRTLNQKLQSISILIPSPALSVENLISHCANSSIIDDETEASINFGVTDDY